MLEPQVQYKQPYAQTAQKSSHSKFVSSGQANLIDENADIDEEDLDLDDVHDDFPNGSNPHSGSDFTLPQDWYFSIAGLYFHDFKITAKAFVPAIGSSSPIYILHSVFRI